MATGRCVNIMKGCSKAKAREIQEADKANFVCSECGKPLVECEEEEKEKSWKRWLKEHGKQVGIISAAVLILAGGGFGIWKACQSDDTIVSEPQTHNTKIASVTTDANWTVETVVGLLNQNDTIWIKANDNISKEDQEKGVKPQISLEDNTSTVIISPESVTDKATVLVKTVDGKSETYFIALHKKDFTEPKDEPGTKTKKTVFGGRATYDKAAGVITFNSTVTISLHDENDNTLTFRSGDQIRGAKVSGGRLVGGEAVIRGESQLLSGISEKL